MLSRPCRPQRRSHRTLLAVLSTIVVCQAVLFLWHSRTYRQPPAPTNAGERVVHTATTRPNSTIIETIWHGVESDHAGWIRVRFAADPSRERDGGRPYLRIRAVGPQIKLLHAERSNDSLLEWIAPYSLECAGSYSVEITPLLAEFYDDDIARGKILPQWPPYVDLLVIEIRASLPACQLGREWRRTPLCNEELMRSGGSWVVDDGDGRAYRPPAWPAARVRQYLARTKMYPDKRFMPAELYERLLPGSLDRLWNSTEIPFGLLEMVFPRLQFRYYQCRPHNGTELWERCRSRANGKPICMVGDSQTRFLHNGFVEVMEPTNTECSTIRNKEVCPTELDLRYSMDCYGDYRASQADSCGMVLINFGQWPISWVEPRPYPATRYQAMVREMMASFAAARDRLPDRSVYWLTTNTMALNGRIIGNIDWRHDPAIELYNRIADREAKIAGVPVIDIYAISSVLNDLSVDRSHYKAPVLTALVHAVATVACQAE